MSVPPWRVRWVGDIAVVGISPNAAGTPVPPNAGLVDMIRGGRGVVVDLIGCNLLNSELLGRIIFVHAAAMMVGINLRVFCPAGSAQEVLLEVRMDRLLSTFATLAEALADFEPPTE